MCHPRVLSSDIYVDVVLLISQKVSSSTRKGGKPTFSGTVSRCTCFSRLWGWCLVRNMFNIRLVLVQKLPAWCLNFVLLCSVGGCAVT